MTALLAISTLPDLESAVKLARYLIDSHAAACVHVLPVGQSVYRWKDSVHTESEVTLLIKTTTMKYAELEHAVTRAHPYELPELIALPITAGLPAYLDWIGRETEGERA